MSITIFNSSFYDTLNNYIKTNNIKNILVLVDNNTQTHCLELFRSFVHFSFEVLSIPAGEGFKTLTSVKLIWKTLLDYNFDRHSLLINLGGGVITDMGGFAAATYKRGIRFINIPTTLLGMVDAAIGGKTGIDYLGLKNQIGVFKEASLVGIDINYLKTLPTREFKSGMGEVYKYALINNKNLWKQLISSEHNSIITEIIKTCVKQKQLIVSSDLHETGKRKTLNFGHSLGHAIESYYINNPTHLTLLHGEAIAIGMILSTYLSHIKLNLPKHEMESIQHNLISNFQTIKFTNHDIKHIKELLQNDKKNQNNTLLFVLIERIGKAKWDIPITIDDIDNAFKQYNSII